MARLLLCGLLTRPKGAKTCGKLADNAGAGNPLRLSFRAGFDYLGAHR